MDSWDPECAQRPQRPQALPSAVEPSARARQVPSSLAIARQATGHPESCQELRGSWRSLLARGHCCSHPSNPAVLTPLGSGGQREGRTWSRAFPRARPEVALRVSYLFLCGQNGTAWCRGFRGRAVSRAEHRTLFRVRPLGLEAPPFRQG